MRQLQYPFWVLIINAMFKKNNQLNEICISLYDKSVNLTLETKMSLENSVDSNFSWEQRP